MRNVLPVIIVAAFAFIAGTAFAADTMGMRTPTPAATTAAYRFEPAGPVESHAGTSTVLVRLIHAADNKPVIGAIISQSRADMTPIGMAGMNAPIKALPVTTPGVWPFEVRNGPMWSKADKWTLTFAARVQGEAATVGASITVELKP